YFKFCENNGYSELCDHFFTMSGCDSTFLFENICNCFGISFFALVDKDFSFVRSPWTRKNKRQVLQQLYQFASEKGIDINQSKIESAMKEESNESPRSGDR